MLYSGTPPRLPARSAGFSVPLFVVVEKETGGESRGGGKGEGEERGRPPAPQDGLVGKGHPAPVTFFDLHTAPKEPPGCQGRDRIEGQLSDAYRSFGFMLGKA